MKKSVCIIGAGPSGLISAKILLHHSDKFTVTIYEKSNRIGGIWSQDETGSKDDTFLGPQTPVNVSRFNVGFSDHDWNSVLDGHAPIFPKAWQVNKYLKTFIAKHDLEKVIHLNHEVIETQRYQRESDGAYQWRVRTRTKDGEEVTAHFDHLILASGFFSKPRNLSYAIPQVNLHPSIRAIHSSQFRTLADLFPSPEDATDKTILIIGGSNSAGEAAAAVAQQLSNARYSPETAGRKLYRNTKIVHVTPKPLYILVPFAAANESSTTFMPWDIRMYDLSKRPPGPIVGNAGRVPQVVKDILHGALQSIVGGDQADLGSPALQVPSGEPRWPVQVALSESYSEFVRNGLVEVVTGRVTALESDCARIITDRGSHARETGAIIYATGYTPSAALDFLPEDVKSALRYDANSHRLPLMLQGWQTMSPELPDLAMIGFYEGPYWPMMEMQARLTAARWIDGTFSDQRPYEDVYKLLDLRQGMSKKDRDVPQYWFGDYAGYMEEVASFLKLQRNDGPFAEREGSVSPARYLSSDADKSQAEPIMRELHTTWEACMQKGKFAARAVFRALQGDWTMTRKIDSSLSSFPSGTLEGTASFHPRLPTQDKSGQSFDFEYLYIESGTLHLSNGASMPARRRYVYRYSEKQDELSVWFVKPDNDFEVDYLFHNLTFASPAEAEKEGACIAKADHLCVDDMYWTEYRLPMKAINLLEFTNTHTVKGPSKDYVATTTYRRPVKVNDVSGR